MKFAIGILVILVAACIIGSVVPQGQTMLWYAQNYSEQMAGILGSLALEESLMAGALDGKRFSELLKRAAESHAEYAKEQSESAIARVVAYVGQSFNVRLKFALSRPRSSRWLATR